MTRPMLTFADIQPAVPDIDSLRTRTESILGDLSRARTSAAAMEPLKVWDGMRREVKSYRSHVSLRFQQDTRDPARKAAREAWDQSAPGWTELEVRVKRALLSHPLRRVLEAELGGQAFALWESEALAFDSAIKADLVAESRLGAQYTEKLAGAKIEFQGKSENLSTLPRFRQHQDRAVRRAAEIALWSWFDANQDHLDRIFSDLVAVRTRMARTLGLDNFVDLAYRRMCRVDYSRADVENFRTAIREVVVPLAAQISARQAKTLGVDGLMAWDETVHDPAGNPLPKGDLDWLVERSREVFAELGAPLGDFFARMADGGFLDLDSRDGKAGGGFCTSFPTHGMPFVFANFNGTKGDVEVLTHEIGHAFQNYSSRELWPCDYHWPTYESAEIHSMSLELLSFPQMERYFQTDAERFRRTHLAESILFLPYGTAVDHFQHELYARPHLTAAERHGLWLEMERMYLPWRNWGDMPHASKGGRWQMQRHIYLSPFYYIDYVLAQSTALQLWAQAETDREGALAAYHGLCAKGGSLPFQGLVRSAGLVSPFDAGCLDTVSKRVRTALAL